MARSEQTTAEAPRRNHKRNPSAVLKSLVNPRNQKGPASLEKPPTRAPASPTRSPVKLPPISSLDHTQPQRHLAEISHNKERGRPPAPVPIDIFHDTNGKSSMLHKRTKSAISLRSLAGRDKDKAPKIKPVDPEKRPKPVKSKSSTGISAILSRPKSSKPNGKEEEALQKDKENRTPPSTTENLAQTPIWAQFSNQRTEEITRTTKIPLNDSWDVEEECMRYSPAEYSPSKGRNFFDDQPTLGKRPELKPRPKSAVIASKGSSGSLMETFQLLRKTSSSSKKGKESKQRDSPEPETAPAPNKNNRKSMEENRKPQQDNSKSGFTLGKGSRVMAAVAAWNGKGKDTGPAGPKEVKLDPESIEKAFEKMLESRNIPNDVKEKMRSLNTTMKADLLKQSQSTTTTRPNTGDATSNSRSTSRPGTAKRSKTKDNVTEPINLDAEADEPVSTKKARPRSLTFTLSKGDHGTSKKSKTGKAASHVRNKSAELPRTPSSTSLNSVHSSSGLGFLGRNQKPAIPEDFISYLKKTQKPELVEIGRLQKLRQLLRNETVAWVDSFITKGGITEIVGLLYRVMDLEWREDHEDLLLHNTLNCLKALLTTSLAMTHLHNIQSRLFPALLALLFSSGESKKGPAEFTTRNLIMSLFFAYLSASPSPNRAATLLSYLRDPLPAESERPVGFITEMHRPRPYKLWLSEVSNVTKEVFWIFLHGLNVIPYPQNNEPNGNYTAAHFPAARPPVAAAPYVGGVEWDATNYLATHLDILNGIIACLPTRGERNALRVELRDSGFEKVMGTTLRTCKEKFYGGVHAGLATWVAASIDDGWDPKDVREGPKRDERRTPRGSPRKKKDEPPKLDMPKLDLADGVKGLGRGDEGWL